MKGLSVPQLGLLSLTALGLLVSLVGVVAEAWVVAAAAAVASFGFFVILVVFTLAALTRSVRRLGELVRSTAPRLRETSAGIRRVDQRTAERFKTLDSAEARLEAAERRLVAAFEAQSQRVEDSVAEAVQHNGQR
ncbi:hypothetical protein [Nesterenkonia natronophila]|uniref:Uncharacterized protein n=1 Tax=Nesterenkonia natronophila TaxID=2174932 RepID=A0A3A4FDU4_9MICC|nr:hypothetical protein [Nesterenkonia natronophila]RJN32974.1 hypothetical protein D3250_03975 [Nesterenkonia natronophila]